MFRPTFAVWSGHAMAAAVDLRDQPDGAVKLACSSFITSFRSLEAVRQPLTISSCVVPRTIGTKRSNASVCLFGKVRRSIRLSASQRPIIDSNVTRLWRMTSVALRTMSLDVARERTERDLESPSRSISGRMINSQVMDVLQRPDWHGSPVHLGELFMVRKNHVEARCVLRSHQFGWELCLQIGLNRDFLQTRVCRTQDEVYSTREQWKAAMIEKGWSQ